MSNSHTEITHLVYRLFRALDEKDDTAASQCFAADGVWLRQGKSLTGPTEIATELAYRDPSRRSVHLISNLQIEEAGEKRWLARYYLCGWVAIDPYPLDVGALLDCSDTIESCPEGLRITHKSSRKLGDVQR